MTKEGGDEGGFVMTRYYEIEKDPFEGLDYLSEASIYGNFSATTPAHQQRALKRNRLHQAVVLSDFEEVESCINEGVELNTQDLHGNTALHLAIANQEAFPEIYLDIIELLKISGASENVKNGYGDSVQDIEKLNITQREEMAVMFDSPPLGKQAA